MKAGGLMKKKNLGINGPIVGAVGYGAMSFTDFYGPADDKNSARILDECVELGIQHIDTSNVYGMGRSETIIGEWLKSKRGDNPFTIATKVGITRNPENRFDNSKEHLTSALDASLKRLGVEAIDLYYIHRRDSRLEIEEVTETMAGFVSDGKVKYIGFSEIAPSSLRRANAVHPIAAVQSEYSLSTRAPELGLLQACEEIGAAFVGFSPVGRGLLTDRPHQLESISEMPFLATNPRFNEPNLSHNLSYNNRFRAVAEEFGVPAASLAIAWIMSRGDHVHAIPGTRNVKHLKELVLGGSLTLSEEMFGRIEEVLPVGWAHGDRYSIQQWNGPERFS